MGSKVSGKMAAAGRVVQAVRPHAPLIKFPNRKGIPRPNVQEALKAVTASLAPDTSPSSTPLPPVIPPSRPPGPVSRLPGTPDTVATVKDLPQRYRRRAVTAEEMEYIQRGGPE
ncbi:28S ribosomal protein S36, mitochondrial [Sardina pilchardus]|uniref:28S ribosomal protein S36, mitochondrial n=1 Tax=Sardina pilchardus TaxID=27697 RepID=UPI002E13B23E